MTDQKEEFQVTPQEIVLTAEVVVGILATVATFGVFPGWLVLLLPMLSADLPAAGLLFTTLWNMLAGAKTANAHPTQVLSALTVGLQQAHANCQAQWTGNSNTGAVWPQA
jgi:hypothetical protein